MPLTIYYDGECPLCARYVRYLRLKETVGEVSLVDLRRDSTALHELRIHGIEPDEGMAIDLDGRWHTGGAAMHILALLSTPHGALNRWSRYAFSNATLSEVLYPSLRVGRNFFLFLLGRRRFSAGRDADAMAPLILFNVAWGLFATLHSISYAFFTEFGARLYPTTALLGVLGLALVVRPADMRLFVALFIALTLDAWLQMPLSSNHTVLKNYFLLAVGVAGIWRWARGDTWSTFYEDFAPAGRVLLAVMYVFGIFHKINQDFLDPNVSCAVALWREMPWPLSLLNHGAIHQAAIWGTFAVEGAILLCLLSRRGRQWGIGLGIAFHSLLALSGYAMYVQFTTLTIALHLLYVDRVHARIILDSTPWRRLRSWLASCRGIFWVLVWITLMTALSWNGSYSQASLVWLPVALFLAWTCVRRGGGLMAVSPAHRTLWSSNLAVNAVSALFFLNCFAPYLGLKTAQSMNMFANLHLEGERSNHLVFSGPPGPFDYLADLVTIEDAHGSQLLSYVMQHDLQMTRYHLLDHLDRNPNARVTFSDSNGMYLRESAETLQSEIEVTLHPRWFRNWFHFNVVDPAQPKPCALDR